MPPVRITSSMPRLRNPLVTICRETLVRLRSVRKVSVAMLAKTIRAATARAKTRLGLLTRVSRITDLDRRLALLRIGRASGHARGVREYCFHGKAGARQFRDQATGAHDQQAVAHARYFRQLGRD